MVSKHEGQTTGVVDPVWGVDDNTHRVRDVVMVNLHAKCQCVSLGRVCFGSFTQRDFHRC